MTHFVQEYPPGTFTPLGNDPPMVVEHVNGELDSQWPAVILTSWTAEQLAAIGVYPVIDFVPPTDFVVTGEPSYVLTNGIATETYDVVPYVPPVPTEITRRQLLIAMWQLGFITEQEALDAATSGEVPASFVPIFDALSGDQRGAAYITWASMSVCERYNPLFLELAALQGQTEQQISDWFTWAATL
jgi:hypothetical protein